MIKIANATELLKYRGRFSGKKVLHYLGCNFQRKIEAAFQPTGDNLYYYGSRSKIGTE